VHDSKQPWRPHILMFLWLVHTANTDCLVLSCRRCELSLRQSQTVFNILETEQFCLIRGVNAFVNWFPNGVTIGTVTMETGSGQDETQFTLHFETGQNCFEIFSHRQY